MVSVKKYPRFRDDCAAILARPEHTEGMTSRQLLSLWEDEEAARRGRRRYVNHPRMNQVANLLAMDKRFLNLRPMRIRGIRTKYGVACWVLNSNHPSVRSE